MARPFGAGLYAAKRHRVCVSALAGNDPSRGGGYPGRLRPPAQKARQRPAWEPKTNTAALRLGASLFLCRPSAGRGRLPRGFFSGRGFSPFFALHRRYSSRSLPQAVALRSRVFITLRVTKLPLHSRASACGRHLPGDDEERKTVKKKGSLP